MAQKYLFYTVGVIVSIVAGWILYPWVSSLYQKIPAAYSFHALIIGGFILIMILLLPISWAATAVEARGRRQRKILLSLLSVIVVLVSFELLVLGPFKGRPKYEDAFPDAWVNSVVANCLRETESSQKVKETQTDEYIKEKALIIRYYTMTNRHQIEQPNGYLEKHAAAGNPLECRSVVFIVHVVERYESYHEEGATIWNECFVLDLEEDVVTGYYVTKDEWSSNRGRAGRRSPKGTFVMGNLKRDERRWLASLKRR